ncbi:MAG: phosphoglucomutase, partial [Actinomycetales bacterium]|nr:phosphoglucomutase [Actinomycetales bacterium]
MHPRAGTVALPEDLVDLDALTSAYYDRAPDLDDPGQQVVFGTSGHRGSSLDGAFNEAHIVAITAAIVEYRRSRGTDGPLFIGRDTHALSLPAWETALEVLAAAGVDVHIDARDGYTPTPAVSHAILLHNGAATSEGVHLDGASSARTGLADGIVVTPSHNPPRDGGFKYNPPHGGPADSEATGWIAARANELLRSGVGSVRRLGLEPALAAPTTRRHDFMSAYVDDLATVLDLDLIRANGVRIGADPLGGASVDYWGAIGERYDLDLTVVNPTVDPRWAFMT